MGRRSQKTSTPQKKPMHPPTRGGMLARMDAGVTCSRCGRRMTIMAAYCGRCGYGLRRTVPQISRPEAGGARGGALALCLIVFAGFFFMMTRSIPHTGPYPSFHGHSSIRPSSALPDQSTQRLNDILRRSNQEIENARKEAERVQRELRAVPSALQDDDHKPSLIAIPPQIHRIVYVCDASDDMSRRDGLMEGVKRELRRSIGSLAPDQQFAVIFAQDGAARALQPRLVPASSEFRSRALGFIDAIQPQGRNDPRSALKLAIRMKPDAIFLLSDGQFDDGEEIIDLCRNQTTLGRPILFNPVAILEKAPAREFLDTAALGTLKRIASQSGGTITYVNASDFGR
jgi:hypothetical protein